MAYVNADADFIRRLEYYYYLIILQLLYYRIQTYCTFNFILAEFIRLWGCVLEIMYGLHISFYSVMNF